MLTVAEVTRLWALLDGEVGWLARWRHGSGMRRMACLSVGVKDVDFAGYAISVREGKGGQDRVVMLPRTRVGPLQTQLKRSHAWWESCLKLT